MVKLYLLRTLAIITSICAYVMVLLGALVTKTGSGQGCGRTWPFCHGQIIPGTLTIEGAYEYTHRISAGAGGFLIILLGVGAWFVFRKDRYIKLFGLLSIFFVLVQGALGALTVMYEGSWELPYLLSVHFGISLLCLASVILLTVRLFQIQSKRYEARQAMAQRYPTSRVFQYATLALSVYTYIVTYTGALVRHSEATLACGEQFPGCGTTTFPNLFSLAGIQMLHRYAAASLWILVLVFLIATLLHYRGRKDLVSGSWWAFILITLQAVCGMAIVLSGGLMVIALLHTTIISVFFSVLCYVCWQAGWPWKKRVSEQQQEQVLVATR